jgi:hypothetical protein
MFSNQKWRNDLAALERALIALSRRAAHITSHPSSARLIATQFSIRFQLKMRSPPRAQPNVAWAVAAGVQRAAIIDFSRGDGGGGAHSQGNYARGAGARHSPQCDLTLLRKSISFISYSHLTTWEITHCC